MTCDRKLPSAGWFSNRRYRTRVRPSAIFYGRSRRQVTCFCRSDELGC
ncbi:unnamed protein product [Amoebophrya sp. A25]|nr:unnamed protein product [Amoebophrya sp. A25]|eukprot:GSA25T00022842001.1